MPRLIHLFCASVFAVTAIFAVTTISAFALVNGYGSGYAPGQDLDKRVPALAMDETVKAAGTGTLIRAGDSFLGVRGVFQHVRGVREAVTGYDGGSTASAHYETVSTGTTGHAESVRSSHDSHVATFGRLLQIYLSGTIDRTQLDRQYLRPRAAIQVGTLYNDTYAGHDSASLDRETWQGSNFLALIVTQVGKDTGFYPEEAYHQNYLALHPDSPYIATFDLPIIAALKKVFPDEFVSKPVLGTHNEI